MAALVVAIRYVGGHWRRALHLFAVLIMLPMLPKKTSLAIATFGALIVAAGIGEIRPAVYARRARSISGRATHRRSEDRWRRVPRIQPRRSPRRSVRFSSQI